MRVVWFPHPLQMRANKTLRLLRLLRLLKLLRLLRFNRILRRYEAEFFELITTCVRVRPFSEL